jgi:hypothetical protein
MELLGNLGPQIESVLATTHYDFYVAMMLCVLYLKKRNTTCSSFSLTGVLSVFAIGGRLESENGIKNLEKMKTEL